MTPTGFFFAPHNSWRKINWRGVLEKAVKQGFPVGSSHLILSKFLTALFHLSFSTLAQKLVIFRIGIAILLSGLLE